ncbi:hypothetical protein, partial [Neisseria gonorrhoeae]|uniref:hypothetical protein n=1 Tax=Neisseria gonorrhoeae TaxID=485 RepID=UPI001E2D15F0
LVDISASILKERVAWARSVPASIGFVPGKFSDSIELHGNNLSRQFERAIAYAKRYSLDTFNETEFWSDF